MIYFFTLFLLLCFSSFLAPQEDFLLLDRIVVIIYTQDGIEIITQSDLDRPSLSGDMRTLDELIFELLVYLDAKKLKMLSDDDALEKFIANIQKDNNMSLEQINQLFIQAGYTPEEGREQLKKMQAINSMFEFKIRSQLIISRKDIVDYYEENPIVVEASYCIQYASIPFTATMTKEQMRQKINKNIVTESITWNDPFWINHEDVAQEKQFIYDMHVGEVRIVESNDKFELFHLKEKKEAHVVPLEERYNAIADSLRRPLYEKLMKEYKKELFDAASIVYL